MRQRAQTSTEYMLLISVVVVAVTAAAYIFVPSFQAGTLALSEDVSCILSGGRIGGIGLDRGGGACGGGGGGGNGGGGGGGGGLSATSSNNGRTPTAGTTGSSAGCFRAGTLVETDGGPRPIEELRENDVVLARNDESKEFEYRPVVHTFVHDDNELYELIVVSGDRKEVIVTTSEHRFWVEEQGWLAVAELTEGDLLVTADAGPRQVVFVGETGERATVYNIEVETDHTYFVGESRIWVHNAKRSDPGMMGVSGGPMNNIAPSDNSVSP